MAKIEESITYNGKICTFSKCIGNINFYTFEENDDEDCENLLLVNKSNNEVLANISINTSYGAYGLGINGYIINDK